MLPIEPVLPRLRHLLADGSGAVLQAPPGAGKTTRVPLALLEEAWLRNQRIILLEPRRLAARAAARRMASLLGEAVGRTVGFCSDPTPDRSRPRWRRRSPKRGAARRETSWFSCPAQRRSGA